MKNEDKICTGCRYVNDFYYCTEPDCKSYPKVPLNKNKKL